MEKLTGIVKEEHIQEARRVITERTLPGRIYKFNELTHLVMEDNRFKTKYPDGNGFNNEIAVEIAIGSSRLFIPTENLYDGKPAYRRIRKKEGYI